MERKTVLQDWPEKQGNKKLPKTLHETLRLAKKCKVKTGSKGRFPTYLPIF